jgi:hypothetical protein
MWLSNESVGAYLNTTARVRGTPVSVRRADLACVPQEDVGEGRALVLVRTNVGPDVTFDSNPALAESSAGVQVWRGTYPRSGLLGLEPSWSDPYAGTPLLQLAGTPDGVVAEVFGAPNGARLLRVASPAGVPAMLVRQEGPWYAVRLGSGPYVVGFTRTAPTAPTGRNAARAQARALLGQVQSSPNARFHNGVSGASNTPPIPEVLRAEGVAQALRRLRAGASLQLDNGEVMAINQPLTVRATSPNDTPGRVRVLAAMTDAVALYGMVDPADLHRVTTQR